MNKLTERTTVWLRITPQMPLLLSTQTAVSNFQQSFDFIPGGSLRGALGSKLIRISQAQFDGLFNGEEPYFGNGYFGGSGPIWPFPQTARTCKRFPGLAERENDHEHHGVVDVLTADFAFDLISDPEIPFRDNLQPNTPNWLPYQLPNDRADLGVCHAKLGKTKCGQPLQPTPGYYMWQNAQPFSVNQVPVSRKTHVGINRARAVAQDNLLYTQERLAVNSTTTDAFFARVSIPTSKVSLLEDAISGEHFIGRGRSRGNGRISINIESMPAGSNLSDRLFDFQQRMSSALMPYQKNDAKVNTNLPGTLFTITLRSAAILQRAGRPLRVPTSSMLNLSNSKNIHCVRAWARMENVGGWDSAARVPRKRALAARAGSAYLFWADDTVDPNTLETELTQLELNGIGEQRARGFGQLTICAPFHYQQW